MNIKEFFDKKTTLVSLASCVISITTFIVVVYILGSAEQERTQVLLNINTETGNEKTVIQEYVSPPLDIYISNLRERNEFLTTEISGLRDVVTQQASKIEGMQNWQPLPPHSTFLLNVESLKYTPNVVIDDTFSCDSSSPQFSLNVRNQVVKQVNFDVSFLRKCRLNSATTLGVVNFRASSSNIESRTHNKRNHFVFFLYDTTETVFLVSDPLVISIPYDDNFSFTKAGHSSILIEGLYGDAGHLFKQSAVFDLNSFTFNKIESNVSSAEILE